MDVESQANVSNAPNQTEFMQPVTVRKPLELLRDTEAFIRRPTVATLTPILPPKLSDRLQVASNLADNSLQELSNIDLEQISDWELKPARILIGLSFVGFGALMLLMLLLYVHTLHPNLNTIEQIRQYWYEYVWCVSLGVAGMFLLGREAMRPTPKSQKVRKSKL
ncbi:hypothetical protein [Anabaena sp. 4-3]|uniref:hypothetical protein n=1 Tax=Anabaena sp. 4-3 TaxID=1811979 RepID=UPI000832EE41|nr:hypothetical protein [Anabaena sp. 4-3]